VNKTVGGIPPAFGKAGAFGGSGVAVGVGVGLGQEQSDSSLQSELTHRSLPFTSKHFKSFGQSLVESHSFQQVRDKSQQLL